MTVLSGTSSDSHTWNLVFLQLLLEEAGHRVANIGPCVPDRLLVEECLARTPGLVVVSSVNGHGYDDGLRAVRELRAQPGLARVPAVIGGKLGVNGTLAPDRVRDLLDAGFDAVFADGDTEAFTSHLSRFGLRAAS
ncbi:MULTISPECIES: cobalamin B12-binding domain-containing protein [unclassified Nocardiopsis]|uniref:cobalamin B12-binding domain-containing protein n=1 Tax=unclassified Nocardiopsis TaxID=2649073 RepID=UPI001EEC4B46|nr:MULTISPECIES: cobalamin-dependent protein [unclassified Nocardiopsis]